METIGKKRHGVLTQTEFFRHHKKGLAGLVSPIYSKGKFIIPFSYSFLLLTVFFLTPLELKAQQHKNVYKVAIDKEYEPYEFLNDKNKADGFTPSLLKEIGKKAGVTFEFVPMTLPAAIKALESGKVDIINMITSQERALLFDFSKPHCRITQALFRNAQNEEIKNLNSLSGHKVGFQTQDISLTTLQRRTDFKKHIDESKLDGLLDLNNGRIEALFCAEQAGIRLISKYGFTNIKLAEGGLFPQDYAFATRKGNFQLMELLNKSLAELQKSGKLQEIKDKWLTGQLPTPSWLERNQNYLLSFGSILSFSLILLLVWNRTLQNRVLDKTKTLQASEERFRQLAENIGEVFWMTDATKSKMLYISPSYEKTWGRSCKSLYDSAHSWIDSVHPEDRKRVLEEALTRQVDASYDEIFRIKRPDGATRWIRDRAFPIEDASGKVYRIAGVAQDITEQKNFEKELNDRENKIHSLLKISRGLENTTIYSEVIDVIYDEIYRTIGVPSVWIYIFDEKLEYATLVGTKGTIAKILKDSTPVLQIKGDPFLEEIALATHTVIIEDAGTDPLTDKKIVSLLGNRTIINVPTILVEHHIGSLGLGTFGDEGLKKLTPSELDYLNAIGSHVASAIDRIQFISELKKIQEELLEKEERYRGLSEASFEAIFISANGVCIEQNLMAEKMFGFTIEEAMGRPEIEWLIPEDRERIKSYIGGRKEEPYEATGLRKDGTTFPCMVHGRTMFYREKNVRVTSVNDISERKQTEEKILQQLKELQRWHNVTLEREDRMIELKQEVNELLQKLNKPKKYLST